VRHWIGAGGMSAVNAICDGGPMTDAQVCATCYHVFWGRTYCPECVSPSIQPLLLFIHRLPGIQEMIGRVVEAREEP